MSPYNYGEYGRCLFWSEGTYGGHTGGGGWGNSSKYFKLDSPDDPETPRIFVGVVDQLGMRTYQIADGSDVWEGISTKTIAMEIPAGPKTPPSSSPCDSKTAFCATFNPFCTILTREGGNVDKPENYDKYRCQRDGRDRGFCGNWAHNKLIALGPESLWGTPGLVPKIDGQVIGAWNSDMESPPLKDSAFIPGTYGKPVVGNGRQ
jgi:hypothetical protein